MILYDWKEQKAIAALTGHSAGQDQPLVGASGDGKTVVSVSKAGEVLVFDLGSKGMSWSDGRSLSAPRR